MNDDFSVNKESNHACGIPEFQAALSGKWKISIIWILNAGKIRFGELHRQIQGITQATLTKQLRELEASGLIDRYVYREVPPKVEYSISKKGQSFIPILYEINEWSINNLK
ncbi:helix-turn-helix domain-containing protein [Lacrimispora sp.]|uniref:winged helix-turn-helix transcriptional regulator n=1 Tax=Lacrimispora sp. TaxID=2719234 RepID=UPI0032E4B74E